MTELIGSLFISYALSVFSYGDARSSPHSTCMRPFQKEAKELKSLGSWDHQPQLFLIHGPNNQH